MSHDTAHDPGTVFPGGAWLQLHSYFSHRQCQMGVLLVYLRRFCCSCWCRLETISRNSFAFLFSSSNCFLEDRSKGLESHHTILQLLLLAFLHSFMEEKPFIECRISLSIEHLDQLRLQLLQLDVNKLHCENKQGRVRNSYL